VEVLEGDETSLDASTLGVGRPVSREGDCDGWVVHCVASGDVCLESGDEVPLRRRASTGDLDGCSGRTVDGTVTVSSSRGVPPSGEAKVRRKVRNVLRSSPLLELLILATLDHLKLAFVDSSLLREERSGRGWATYAWSVQVLEGNDDGLDTRDLGRGGVVRREVNRCNGILDSVACGDVGVQLRQQDRHRRWAGARDQDTVRTLAVSMSVRARTSLDTKRRDEVGGDATALKSGTGDGANTSENRNESGGVLHVE